MSKLFRCILFIVGICVALLSGMLILGAFLMPEYKQIPAFAGLILLVLAFFLIRRSMKNENLVSNATTVSNKVSHSTSPIHTTAPHISLTTKQIMQIRNDSRIMSDSFKILQETTNFDVFFRRLGLAQDKANALLDFKAQGYAGLSDELENACKGVLCNVENLKILFLHNTTNKEIEAALQLKTPKGRSDRLSKHLNVLKKYQPFFSDVATQHISAMTQVTDLIAKETLGK